MNKKKGKAAIGRSSSHSRAPSTTEHITFSIRNYSTYRKRKDGSAAVPFSWKLWSKSKYEEACHSLFLAPSLAVVAGVICAAVLTFVDMTLTAQDDFSLPDILTTTVESARTVLGTVAGATISFAGIAFSVSLLVIQLGASQLSPRVVHTLFKDQFNKRVMALVVGTFTYCLVVLRSVRHALPGDDGEDGQGGQPIVPNISVAVAVVLGILSILATVAFIDHSAHSMDVSQILETVTRETIVQIRHVWVEVANMTTVQVEIDQDGMMCSCDALPKYVDDKDNHNNNITDVSSLEDGSSSSHVVRFRRSGWVQEIDLRAILPLVPAGGCIDMHTIEGRYAIPGAAVCTITWRTPSFHRGSSSSSSKDREAPIDSVLPGDSFGEDDEVKAGDDDEDNDDSHEWLEDLEDNILNCIQIGVSRTMRLDPAYGLRELVDVTLRALSPGVNDPTTAQDGIFHTAAVVIEFLKRNPPPHQYVTPNGGIFILGEQHDHDGIVRLAYDEARKCAASSPTVCIYLLESLRLIRESLRAEGLDYCAPEIERQVRLIEEGCLLTKQVPDDYSYITQARRDRFSDEDLGASVTPKIPPKDEINTDMHMPAAVSVNNEFETTI